MKHLIKGIIAILLVLLVSNIVVAQEKIDSVLFQKYLKKAQNNFRNKNYSKAAKYYQKLTFQDSSSLYNYQTALSYYLADNKQAAYDWFDNMMLQKKVNPHHIWNYFKILKDNGDYQLAMDLLVNNKTIIPDSLTKPYFTKINLKSSKVDSLALFCKSKSSISQITPMAIDSVLYYKELRVMSSKIREPLTALNGAINQRLYNLTDSLLLKKYKLKGIKLKNAMISLGSDHNHLFFTRFENTKRGNIGKIYIIKTIYKNIPDTINQFKKDSLIKIAKSRDIKYIEEELFKYDTLNLSIGYCTYSQKLDMLVFSARKLSESKVDLYYTTKTDSIWNAPKKFSGKINTNENEIFPVFDKDGTLYFSSNGLPGYGKFDVFKALIKNKKIISVKNLGQPINSNENEIGYTKLLAYNNFIVSSNRGKGNNYKLYTMPKSSAKYLDIKVMLEGPYNSKTKLMNTTLNKSKLIPLSNPFHQVPWNYDGDEQVETIPNTHIVDWVMVELRKSDSDAKGATKDNIILRKACFLLNNGQVVDLDGESLPKVNIDLNEIYVLIRHRNHLDIQSSKIMDYNGKTYKYDFTLLSESVVGGDNGMIKIDSMWFMQGGDANINKNSYGAIQNKDVTKSWSPFLNKDGYLGGDIDLDGWVRNNDLTKFINKNMNKSGLEY